MDLWAAPGDRPDTSQVQMVLQMIMFDHVFTSLMLFTIGRLDFGWIFGITLHLRYPPPNICQNYKIFDSGQEFSGLVNFDPWCFKYNRIISKNLKNHRLQNVIQLASGDPPNLVLHLHNLWACYLR